MLTSAVLLATLGAAPTRAEASAPEECDCEALAEQVTALQSKVEELRGQRKLVSQEGVGSTRWGMTPKQVKRKYRKLQDSDGKLVRETSIAGLDAVQIFMFAQDKLTVAGVVFAQSYTNKNQYASDYQTLQALLTKKYGEPKSSDAYWSQDLYRDDPQHIGMAIGMGHARFISTWQTEKTDVELALYGNNFDVTLRIRYSSRELEALQEQEDEAAKLSDL